MEIKVVHITGKTGNRSKYLPYFLETFTDDAIEQLKQSLEQIRGKPTLGIMFDISDIKEFSARKNTINERGLISEDGQVKTYGTIANALAKFLLSHGIKGVSFTIKEQNDKVYVTIKDISGKAQDTLTSTSSTSTSQSQ